MAGTNLRSTLPITTIDQHSAGGKLLQKAVQEKLKEYMGADYDDEVLPLYIVVMLSHGNPEQLVAENLDAFLGVNSSKFAAWLFAHVAEVALYTTVEPAIVLESDRERNIDVDAVMDAGLSDGGEPRRAAPDATGGGEELSAPNQDKMRFEDQKAQERAELQERERAGHPRNTYMESYHDGLLRSTTGREPRGAALGRVKSAVITGEHFREHAMRQEHDNYGRHGDRSQLLDRRRPYMQLRSRSRSPPRRQHRPPYESRQWLAEPWQQRPYGTGPRDSSEQGHYPLSGMHEPQFRGPSFKEDNRLRDRYERFPEDWRSGRSGWRQSQDVVRQPEMVVRWGGDTPDLAMLESAQQPGRQQYGYGASLVPPAVDFEAKARDVGGLYRAPSRLLMNAVSLATDSTEATAPQPVPESEFRKESYMQSQPASVFERLSESALTRSIAPAMTSNSPSVQPGVRSVWERLQNGAASGSAIGLDPPASSPSAEELAILDLQRLMVRIDTELSEMRGAAWRQHEAQPQISRLRVRRGAVRAAASVAVSNLHFKASESVVAAHFSVIGPVVRVTIPFKQKGRGFVEFADAVTARSALALSGSILMQRPITVKTPVVQQARSKLQNAVWTRMPLAGSNA